MKICYLMLAHNNPEHFGRLLNALASPRAAVFIHIDAKSDISDFVANAHSDAIFINNRVPVTWGGFSMIQASLNLIAAALASATSYDYYCLLSGSDYPLKSAEFIEAYFARNNGAEFINLVEIPNAAVSKPLTRITQYWLDAAALETRGIPPRVVRKITRLVGKLNIQRDYRRRLRGITPFAGSQWWALSRPAVLHIMQFVVDHPEIVRYFKNVYIPDESFFQTLVGNSSFRNAVSRNLTFTDWSRPQGPYPALIDADHVRMFGDGEVFADDAYGKGQLLFARKFPNDSKRLVERIRDSVW